MSIGGADIPPDEGVLGGLLVVVFDELGPSPRGLQDAIGEARRRRARLEFRGVVGRTPWGVAVWTAHGLWPGSFRREAESRILARLRSALSTVPGDMSVTSRLVLK